jgi:hypothetical protein
VTTDSNTNAAEKPMSIRECLDAVHKAGGNAWDKVADPDGFIRWMRGSDDPKDVAAAEQAMQSMPAQSPASAPEHAKAQPRSCTCPVGERPTPCTEKYALSECLAASAPEQASVAAIEADCDILDSLLPAWGRGKDQEDIGRSAVKRLRAAALSPRPSDLREQQAEQVDGGVEAELCQIVKQCAAARADLRDDDQQPSVRSAIRRILCIEAGANQLRAALTQPPRQSEDGRVRKALELGLEALQLVNGRRAAGECPRDWIRDSGAPTTLLNKVVEAIDAMSAVLTWEEA